MICDLFWSQIMSDNLLCLVWSGRTRTYTRSPFSVFLRTKKISLHQNPVFIPPNPKIYPNLEPPSQTLILIYMSSNLQTPAKPNLILDFIVTESKNSYTNNI